MSFLYLIVKGLPSKERETRFATLGLMSLTLLGSEHQCGAPGSEPLDEGLETPTSFSTPQHLLGICRLYGIIGVRLCKPWASYTWGLVSTDY